MEIKISVFYRMFFLNFIVLKFQIKYSLVWKYHMWIWKQGPLRLLAWCLMHRNGYLDKKGPFVKQHDGSEFDAGKIKDCRGINMLLIQIIICKWFRSSILLCSFTTAVKWCKQLIYLKTGCAPNGGLNRAKTLWIQIQHRGTWCSGCVHPQ